MYPEQELGTLGERTLAEMVFYLKQLVFGLDKHNSLPKECKECRFLQLCWGECPRTRVHRTREGEEPQLPLQRLEALLRPHRPARSARRQGAHGHARLVAGADEGHLTEGI